jgi:carboxymethylenebutenolidase
MIEDLIEIVTPSGRMDAFTTHPEEGGPFPAVVIFMDIWGLREELFDVARRVATVGYHCTLPNFYYRQGKVRFEFRDERGRMKSMVALPQGEQDRILAQLRSLSDQMVVDDVRCVLDSLRTQPVQEGAKGSIGYCMGGRHALCVAAAYPDHFRATASLHGTRLVSDAPSSLHRLADRYRGEIYCGFAEHDDLAPPATIEALASALQGRANVRYRYRVHGGAIHGYSLPDRDVHDKRATDRDWESIFAMFARVLARPRPLPGAAIE